MGSHNPGDGSNEMSMVSFDPAIVVPNEGWDIVENEGNFGGASWQTMPAQRNGFSCDFRNDTVKSLPSRCIRRATQKKRRRQYSQMESRYLLTDVDSSAYSSRPESQNSLSTEYDPLAKQIKSLREKLESLSTKRQVKAHLVRSESQRSKQRPISFCKQAKYQLSMSFDKLKRSLRNVWNTLELWYSSLKTIEGHFGSGVAIYFQFLRWLFIHNCIVLFISGFFLVTPQLLYQYVALKENSPSILRSNLTVRYDNYAVNRTLVVNEPVEEKSSAYYIASIFSGEGFLTNSSLYYGFYTNESLVLVDGVKYHIPSAYFFTFLICFLITFISLSTSMAKSYRQSFIETSNGLNNVYALKIFCSWDFGISSPEAATLSSKQIYHELKELVDEWRYRENVPSWLQRCTTVAVQISLNIIFVLLLAGTAVLMWDLLGGQSKYFRSRNGKSEEQTDTTMIMSCVVSVIMLTFPMLFSYVVKYEGYRSPRTALYVTLLRTFVLELVVVGVLVSFWLKTSTACWETKLGQEVYRLVIADFFISLIGTSLAECLRSVICRKVWPKIGPPEFDIARNTLSLIYNQTLFWVGFYFSPLLALIIVMKLFLTFYIKKYGALYNCQSSPQSWRAAQTHSLFLALTFLSLIGVSLMYGYIIVQVPASQCGPFRGYPYIYQMILEGILNLRQDGKLFSFIMFVTRPGFVAGFLIAMGAAAYYLRAQSRAQRDMVDILRQLLVREARDKEFLLKYFDKIEMVYGKGAKSHHRIYKDNDEVDEGIFDASRVWLGGDSAEADFSNSANIADTVQDRKSLSLDRRNVQYVNPFMNESSQSEDLLMHQTPSDSSTKLFAEQAETLRR